jgi:Tol biopolymer transport system component
MNRALLLAATCALALVLSTATATGVDSQAPKGAADYWLPNEQWVNLLWLPYDEGRLYQLLGHDRGYVFRWVRTERTLAQLGRRRGWTVDRLADALVAPRRDELTKRKFAMVRRRAERTLTQGHLGQHLLFHALHQTAIPTRATRIFGTRTREEFLKLRRAELSPLQIGELNGRTRVEMTRGAIRALEDATALGVREGTLTRKQAGVMLERQVRSVPRWLGQSRYNGPSGGNRPLPWGDFAKHPTISANGSVVIWDAYRATTAEAERLGEIHVRGEDLGTGRTFGVSPGRRDPRRPRSAYNSVISGDGRTVAFESSESTYPLAKRVGQMTVFVRDLDSGAIDQVSHDHRPPNAPSRTAFNPSLSEDGRVVVFEATDAGEGGQPSHNAVWAVVRGGGLERFVAHGSIGAAYLPEVSGDGRTVVYTSATEGANGATQVFATDLRNGRIVMVARASGVHGAPADSDAYDPSVSRDGRLVAFVSRARNLGAAEPGRAAVYVRDLRTSRTEQVNGSVADRNAASPVISPTGRFVAFLSREGRPDGSLEGLRSRLWLYDRETHRTTLVSRADGRDGAIASGYNSEPSISADGTRVAFTSTAGNLSEHKPADLPGVFVRDLSAGTTKLLSSHARRRGDYAQPTLLERARRLDHQTKLGLAVAGLLTVALCLAAALLVRRTRPA